MATALPREDNQQLPHRPTKARSSPPACLQQANAPAAKRGRAAAGAFAWSHGA